MLIFCFLAIIRTLALALTFSLSPPMCAFFSFCRCISVHIAHIIHTSNELHSTTVWRIRSMSAKWMNEWMNRGYIIFAVENNRRQNWLPSFLLCFSSWQYHGEGNGSRRDSNTRNGWLKPCKKKCMAANKEHPTRGRKTAKRDNEDRKGKRNRKNNNAISKKNYTKNFSSYSKWWHSFFDFLWNLGYAVEFIPFFLSVVVISFVLV